MKGEHSAVDWTYSELNSYFARVFAFISPDETDRHYVRISDDAMWLCDAPEDPDSYARLDSPTADAAVDDYVLQMTFMPHSVASLTFNPFVQMAPSADVVARMVNRVDPGSTLYFNRDRTTRFGLNNALGVHVPPEDSSQECRFMFADQEENTNTINRKSDAIPRDDALDYVEGSLERTEVFTVDAAEYRDAPIARIAHEFDLPVEGEQ